MRTLIPWTNLNLPVCSKSQWNKNRVIATRKTPTGNTSQNRLNDSSATLASEISRSIKIPVIGIGAGKNVDGQVLVLHDFLGMTQKFNPRFLRRYLNLSEKIDHAVKEYTKDVKNSSFPNSDEQY